MDDIYPDSHEHCSKALNVKRPVLALVLALVSVILCPILAFFELTTLILAAMVTSEPTNTVLVKVLAWAVFAVIGCLAIALPVIALILGTRARAAAKSTPTMNAGNALAAVVIAGIVTAGVLGWQVYLVLMAAGA